MAGDVYEFSVKAEAERPEPEKKPDDKAGKKSEPAGAKERS